MGYLSLNPAPADDIPAFTYATLSTAAAPAVAGGVWLREKRVGAAETTGVGGPSGALDLTGSTRFAYPGLRSASAYAANPTHYVQSDMKPGGTPQNAYWVHPLDFMTDSPVVELRLNAPAATLRLGLVFVDGCPIQGLEAVRTSGRSAGSGYSATLTLPSAATLADPRRITIYDLNNMLGRFGGLAVPSGYSVWKPPAPTEIVAGIGDSYVAGAGQPPTGAAVSETFFTRLAILMGADSMINAGIGSTGTLTTLSGQPLSNFAGRVSDVLAMNPTKVIIAGGRNDPASGLQAALESLLDSLASVPEIYVIPTASNSSGAAVRTAMAAACASRGVPFLDVNIDALPKNPDGIHPTWQGHQDLADAAFALMSSPATVAVPTSAVTITSPAATVTAGADLAAPAAAAILAALPPAVAAAARLTPSVAALAVVAHPPTVSAAADVVVVSTAAIAISGHAPTVAGGARVDPPAAHLGVVAHPPAVTAGGSAVVDAPAASLTAAALAPSATAAASTTVPASMLQVSAHPPSVSAGFAATVSPPPASAFVSALAPIVRAAAWVDAPAAQLDVITHAPSVAADVAARVEAPAARLTVQALAPGVSVPSAITVPLAGLQIAAHAPSMTAGWAIAPPAAAMRITPHAPTVWPPAVLVPTIRKLRGTAPDRRLTGSAPDRRLEGRVR